MVREHRTEDTEATEGEEEALVWFADSVAGVACSVARW
jgi:hypothetical protein